MSVKKFEVGDLVWAKMSRYSFWPSKIVPPPSSTNLCDKDVLPRHYVHFFGTYGAMWILDENIVPHSEEVKENSSKTYEKNNLFNVAMKEFKLELDQFLLKEKLTVEKSSLATSNEASPPLINPSLAKQAAVNISKEIRPIKVAQKREFCEDEISSSSKKSSFDMASSSSVSDKEKLPSKDEIPSCSNEIILFDLADLSSASNTNDDCPSTSSFIEQSVKPSSVFHMDTLFTSLNVSNLFGKDDSNDSSLIMQGSGNKAAASPEISSGRLIFSDGDASNASSQSNQLLFDDNASNASSHSSEPLSDNDASNFSSLSSQSLNDASNALKHNNQSLSDKSSSGDVSNEIAFLHQVAEYSKHRYEPDKEQSSYTPNFINATRKNIGFLGLGEKGSIVAKKLLNTGHYLTVWDESRDKYADFLHDGAEVADFPADVILKCDITICCASRQETARKIVFGEKGVKDGFDQWNKKGDKGYVEMTSLEPRLSEEIDFAISERSGRYLEAIVADVGNISELSKSKKVLCSGNMDLFHDCETCFVAICHNLCFLSHNVGEASKLKAISNMIIAAHHAGLREAMSLLRSRGLPLDFFLHLLSQSSLSSPAALNYGFTLLHNDAEATSGFKNVQRDIFVANSLKQSHGFLTAELNNYCMRAKRGDYDTLAAERKEGMQQNENL